MFFDNSLVEENSSREINSTLEFIESCRFVFKDFIETCPRENGDMRFVLSSKVRAHAIRQRFQYLSIVSMCLT